MNRIYSTLYIVLALIVGFLLFKYATYNFIQQEEFQLFLSTKDNILSLISQPGGFSELCGLFTTQYYVYPIFGAVANTIIITLCAIFFSLSLKQIADNWMSFGASLALAIFFMNFHSELCYSIDGSFAILISLICLNYTLSLNENRQFKLISIGSLLIVFWLCGQLVLPYSVMLAFMLCLKRYKELVSYAIILVLGGLLFVVSCYGYNQIPLWKGFEPLSFHENQLNIYTYIYYVWLRFAGAFLLSATCLWLCCRFLKGNVRIAVSGVMIAAALVAVVTKSLPSSEKNFSRMTFYLNHLTRQERWDKVMQFHEGRTRYSAYNNTCLNYALVRKGELADKMFNYYQQGLSGLFPEFDKKYFTNILLSDIFLAVGCPNVSESYATEELVTARRYSNPRVLKNIILADEMKGEYTLADKYLDIMAKTTMYADWAKNEKANMKRNAVLVNDADSLLSMSDMEHLLSESIANTGNRTAWEYLGAAYLLSRDKDKFYTFLTEQTPDELKSNLPTHFQEGALILIDDDKLKDIAISDEVRKRYDSFLQILKRKDMAALAREFNKTYWLYAFNTGLK